MPDLLPNDWRPRLRRFLLDLDSRLDSTVFHSGAWLREYYERFSTFMDRFHVSGWRRLSVEFFSEAATLGTGGLMLMLALAIPAFHETSDDDWLKKSELAVTFLDRYGNEIGSRGIRHNDSIPLEQYPDHLIKAVLSTEDRRFYEHFGIDAERAAAHVGAIEIELEDLVFRQPGLQPDRQKRLFDLALDRAFVAEEQVLGELLRDRGAALHDAAGSCIGG